MSYRENKARFERTEIMAVRIGTYAYYRHKVLTFCFPDLFDSMYESGRLKEHLEDVQIVMDSYMKDHAKLLTNSDEYIKMKKSEGYEKAYYSVLKPQLEKEEERMGNRWVCVKDPYRDELFIEWLVAAKVLEYAAEKNSGHSEDE